MTPNHQPQPAETTRPDQLAGLVERVTFHNDESGFCVLCIKAQGHRELVTVVGTLPEVRAGEWLVDLAEPCDIRQPRIFTLFSAKNRRFVAAKPLSRAL